MARTKIKKDKICLVCGETFKATGKVNTCGGACRIKLSRLKKADQKPGYCLLAKKNGQELPEWIVLFAKDLYQKQSDNKKQDKPTAESAAPKTEENLTYFQKRQRGLI